MTTTAITINTVTARLPTTPTITANIESPPTAARAVFDVGISVFADRWFLSLNCSNKHESQYYYYNLYKSNGSSRNINNIAIR